MLQLAFEAFIVGIINLVVGFIISYISMGDKAKTFDHWTGVLLSFFITGVIISYIFAKAKFDSPEFEIKAEALVKYKKIIEGERNELAIKLAKAEERAENARSSYNDIMPFLINMDLANKLGFKNITNDIKKRSITR